MCSFVPLSLVQRHIARAPAWVEPTGLTQSMDFLSNVSSIDERQPSLFELIAQDQLRDLLQPAIRYVLAVIPKIVKDVASETV